MDYNPQNNGMYTPPVNNVSGNNTPSAEQSASQNNIAAGASMGNYPNNQQYHGQNGYTGYSNSASPSSIYNNTPQNNAPQYHYGMPQSFMNPRYLEEQRKKLLERRHHEKKIKNIGAYTGATLLGLLLISFALSYLLVIPTFKILYQNSLVFSSAFGIIYSVLSVGLPFLICSKFLKSSKALDDIHYNPPTDRTKTLLLILIGFGGCLAANYLTSVLRAIAEGMGFYSNYSSLENPSNAADVLMIFIGSAVIPPLVEEFAIRGVLLGSLKKYGNTFAILTSAFIFGLFHGNAVQMPFAFLCGLFLGYAVIASGSLWTGVIIHALVNSMSCISSALIYYLDEYASNTFFYAASVIGVAAGVFALVVYVTRYKNERIFKAQGVADVITPSEKFGKFISSPVMIIAIIAFVLEAVINLSFVPAGK